MKPIKIRIAGRPYRVCAVARTGDLYHIYSKENYIASVNIPDCCTTLRGFTSRVRTALAKKAVDTILG